MLKDAVEATKSSVIAVTAGIGPPALLVWYLSRILG